MLLSSLLKVKFSDELEFVCLRVTVSGELMFLESHGNYDVTNTVTVLLGRHKTIFHYDF